MKSLLSISFLLSVCGFAAGPGALSESAIGGCTATHTSTSDEFCKPDATYGQYCYQLTYLGCHTTEGLDLDIACVDNQLNNPCFDCGGMKDADWDSCGGED